MPTTNRIKGKIASAKEKRVKHYLWQATQPNNKRIDQPKTKSKPKHKALVVVVHRYKIPQLREQKQSNIQKQRLPKNRV